MGLTHITYLIDEGFAVADTLRENIRFAFRVDLPFRLRLGRDYKHQVAVRGRTVDIHLRNDVSVPKDAKTHEIISQQRNISGLFTRAVVLVADPTVSEESLEELRASNPQADDFKYPHATSEVFIAQQALNQFVVAYGTATGQVFGGAPLRVFRTHDFFDYLRWGVTIIGRASALSPDNIEQILALRPNRQIVSVQSLTGELSDLADSEVAQISDALSLHTDFVFYEYAFEAKSKMVGCDYVGALLMAVAALEGAHGAFVSRELAQRLPENADSDLPEKFIRELGMSLCNQLSPFLFLDEADRPSFELIREAGKGLKYRNEVMHALRNRRGQYRTRLRTNRELSDAFSSVLKLYEIYRAAFERIESTTV